MPEEGDFRKPTSVRFPLRGPKVEMYPVAIAPAIAPNTPITIASRKPNRKRLGPSNPSMVLFTVRFAENQISPI